MKYIVPMPKILLHSVPHITHRRFYNIPEPLTPLCGREQIRQTLYSLLTRSQIRLLTLTGMPGVGKTRVAQVLSHDLLEEFADGIYFIPLAHITDPDLLVFTITDVLGLHQDKGHSLLQHLKASLREKQILLVLDTFEHILSVSPLLTEILLACPDIKILVTSRAILHLEGEYVFTIPPLPLPDRQHSAEPQAIAQSPAVELFIERVKAILPEFELTIENAPIIAKICTLVDGLPLAIILASARTKLLSLDTLLTHLEKNRLEVLTQGTRDAPARQQTFHNAISWSYDLLSSEEQTLFRRLAVFAGGCTLEAAQTVCTSLGDLTISLFDGVSVLLDNSLLIEREDKGQERRFIMPETLREYALDLLAASGELEAACEVHAAYFLALAEHCASALPVLQPPPPATPRGLTPREVEVLKLLASGLSNSRIAEQLVLSPHTVSVHVQSIYHKLNIHSRSAATRFVLEHQLGWE